MVTAHGVLPGSKSPAVVDAKPPVSVPAEAFGNGQASGHVAPMLEGAKANRQAIGLGEEYFAGQLLRADSTYHSEETRKACAQDKLDASIPDTHFRQRDPPVSPASPGGATAPSPMLAPGPAARST